MAEDGLEALGQHEEQAGQDEHDQGRGERVEQEAALGEQRHVEHRPLHLPLAQHQCGDQDHGRGEHGEDQRVAPAAAGPSMIA